MRSVLPPRRAVCSTPLQGLAQALAARDGAGGQLPPAQAAGRPRGGRVGSCPQAPGGLEHTCDFHKEGSGMTPTESSGTRWSGEHPRTLAIVCVGGGGLGTRTKPERQEVSSQPDLHFPQMWGGPGATAQTNKENQRQKGPGDAETHEGAVALRRERGGLSQQPGARRGRQGAEAQSSGRGQAWTGNGSHPPSSLGSGVRSAPGAV